MGQVVRDTFNRVSLPISWHVAEAEETVYRWDETDRLLEWAENNELDVTAGPLIDFSSAMLPAWLWLWEQDVPSMPRAVQRTATGHGSPSWTRAR